MHIPKEERKKLDVKSRKCVLLGYGSTTKGYRLYDPQKRKVFHSRDVIFNEQKYGLDESSEPQKEPESRVNLKYSDEPSETVDSPAPPPRRSERERRQPSYFGFQCTSSNVKEPECVSDAQKSEDWADAMQAEMDSLHDHNVWELVKLPEGRKPVGSKWVF